MIPYKSGLEITAYSKKNYPAIPVIIVSALGKEDLTVIEGFQLGVDDFIAKPFNPIELVLRVKRFVYLIPFKESRKNNTCVTASILIKDYLCTKYTFDHFRAI
jgi:DNA-binding response OmpR family regulator